MRHWELCASKVKPLISLNKYARSCVFAGQIPYVNELCLNAVSESERHSYSFDAHSIEHVKNILCCNISRWALSVRATSQASYCRIDHTDPHLQKHTQTQSASLPRYCPGITVRSRCSALFHLFFSLTEWAQAMDSSLILPGGFNRKCDMIMAFKTILNIWCVWDSSGCLFVFFSISTAVLLHRIHLLSQRNVEK